MVTATNRKARKPAAAKVAPRRRQRSPEKIQQNEATRLQLLEAAAKLIGRYGYFGCTIARVTERAKVAHGTFYLHFKSQQELFDAILPSLGTRMVQGTAVVMSDTRDVLVLERESFQLNFAYLAKHPYMYRLLSETEVFAPEAFRAHMETLVVNYAKSLRDHALDGQLDQFDDDELTAIATMMMGARYYLLRRYAVKDRSVAPFPHETFEAYMRMFARALGLQDTGANGANP